MSTFTSEQQRESVTRAVIHCLLQDHFLRAY